MFNLFSNKRGGKMPSLIKMEKNMWIEYIGKGGFTTNGIKFSPENAKHNVKEEIGKRLVETFPSKFKLTDKEALKQEVKEDLIVEETNVVEEIESVVEEATEKEEVFVKEEEVKKTAEKPNKSKRKWF